MSDRVAMMDSGTILQLGKPDDLYARPANVKVAQFIGTPAINLLPARVGAAGTVELFGADLPIRVRRPAGTTLTLGIRPQAVTPATTGTAHTGLCALDGRLRRSENLGAEHILHVDLAAPATGALTGVMAGDPEALVDDARRLALLFAPSACHVFDTEGARIDDVEAVPSAPTRMARAL